jgi:hypothetical protein
LRLQFVKFLLNQDINMNDRFVIEDIDKLFNEFNEQRLAFLN